MKKLIFALSIAALAACGQAAKETEEATETNANVTIVGEEFEAADVVDAGKIATLVTPEASKELVVSGKINECCQKKGCWMKMDMGGGEEMHVTFKDYGFFVPMDCGGKTAVMKGVASYDTISVDVLRHYAEDAGKSKEEIEAITEPELQLVFEATGVKIE